MLIKNKKSPLQPIGDQSMWRLARIVLLATTASAVSISAFAADLPARMEPVAPVAYVPAFSWTGFYVGGELGLDTNEPQVHHRRASARGAFRSSRPGPTRMV